MPYQLLPKVIISKSICGLCRRPYPGHPKGCINFNKKKACPPFVPLYDAKFCMDEVLAIWNSFDIGKHIDRMREAHPEWSDRQLACCLYWQKGARKILEAEINEFYISHPDMYVTRIPEAMGVNITETMRGIGIELEWPPKHYALQIALAARLK